MEKINAFLKISVLLMAMALAVMPYVAAFTSASGGGYAVPAKPVNRTVQPYTPAVQPPIAPKANDSGASAASIGSSTAEQAALNASKPNLESNQPLKSVPAVQEVASVEESTVSGLNGVNAPAVAGAPVVYDDDAEKAAAQHIEEAIGEAPPETEKPASSIESKEGKEGFIQKVFGFFNKGKKEQTKHAEVQEEQTSPSAQSPEPETPSKQNGTEKQEGKRSENSESFIAKIFRIFR